MKRLALALISIALTCALAGCGPKPDSWIVSYTAIEEMEKLGPSEKQTTLRMDGARTFVTGGDPRAVGFARSVPTAAFTSFATFEKEVGSLENVKAALYDCEAWTLTPPDEQADPAGYMRKFCQLAHEHHLLCITTPGRDLAEHQPGSDLDEKYLAMKLPESAARYADYFEIQSQHDEVDAQAFAGFVAKAAAQARRANPSVRVLAGLSTAHGKDNVAADQMLRAADAVARTIVGFWLNIPRKGEACPGCPAEPHPEIAVRFLAAWFAQ